MSKYLYLLNFVQISCSIPPPCAGWRGVYINIYKYIYIDIYDIYIPPPCAGWRYVQEVVLIGGYHQTSTGRTGSCFTLD